MMERYLSAYSSSHSMTSDPSCDVKSQRANPQRVKPLRTARSGIACCAVTNIPCTRYDLRANESVVRATIGSDSDPVLTCVGHYVQHSSRRPRYTPISENHVVTKLILGMAPEEQYLCNQDMIRIVVLYKRIRTSESDSFLHHQRTSNCGLTPEKTADGRTRHPLGR